MRIIRDSVTKEKEIAITPAEAVRLLSWAIEGIVRSDLTHRDKREIITLYTHELRRVADGAGAIGDLEDIPF